MELMETERGLKDIKSDDTCESGGPVLDDNR